MNTRRTIFLGVQGTHFRSRSCCNSLMSQESVPKVMQCFTEALKCLQTWKKKEIIFFFSGPERRILAVEFQIYSCESGHVLVFNCKFKIWILKMVPVFLAQTRQRYCQRIQRDSMCRKPIKKKGRSVPFKEKNCWRSSTAKHWWSLIAFALLNLALGLYIR